MRGFLHAHPNGSAAFLHRVSAFAKFKLSEDDPRPISHVTLPSCAYFQHRGWNPRVVPLENLAPGLVRARSGETQGGAAEGSLAAALATAPEAAAAAGAAAGTAGAGGPAAQECAFDMHTLYDASRRCARYNYNSAPGDQPLPLFEVRLAG